MKYPICMMLSTLFFAPLVVTAKDSTNLEQEVQRLQQQTQALQTQLARLQKQIVTKPTAKKTVKKIVDKPIADKPTAEIRINKKKNIKHFHESTISVHLPDADPESVEFYPTALVADNQVVTYISGTPVVSSPYLGSRPAFDGSDYIVNISSINRDIRLMQQRRQLYRSYTAIGYTPPTQPTLALSGAVEPLATLGDPFTTNSGDLTLGRGEVDVAAILNANVEGYIAIAYDASPPDVVGQRISNSNVFLNMGFVNIGNLDKSPIYFTAGQLYAPFGRFSSAMVSSPLTQRMARTKTRPFILGYKSQHDSGPFAALYAYHNDLTLGSSAAGGINLGYTYRTATLSGEVGVSAISEINDAGGMQFTGSPAGTTFGGFASPTNGNEAVGKVPAVGAHGTLNVDRYSFTAEWVGTTQPFRVQDLSFNGRGAQPQAFQLEAGMTFMMFNKPSSVNIGYQQAKDTLALNIPQQRIAGVFNISIWKDTVESLEYRHDINYAPSQYANGAAPNGFINQNTYGPGGSADTLLAQIGVYF